MNLRKWSVALLALLLAAMAMVPMVSANDSLKSTTVTDKDVQAIFDSASVSETLPSSLSPQLKAPILNSMSVLHGKRSTS